MAEQLDLEDYIEEQGGERGCLTLQLIEEELVARFAQTIQKTLSTSEGFALKTSKKVFQELEFVLKKNHLTINP